MRVQYPKRGGGWGDNSKTEPTDLRLDVPRFAELEIESVSADVDVVGTAARTLEISSVSGDVVVAGAPGQAEIESVSGDLRVTVNSPDAHVETVSGDVTLRGKLDGEAHAESVSGDIILDSNGLSLRRVETGTVSGDANIRVGLANGGSIKSESVSGEINLVLPKSLSARVAGGELQRRPARARRGDHQAEIRPGIELRASLRQRQWRHPHRELLRQRRPETRIARLIGTGHPRPRRMPGFRSSSDGPAAG